MISLSDTHRTLYKNAKIRAFDYENRTEQLNFKTPDGVSAGTVLHTNADGYTVSASNTQQLVTYFLEKKAIVQVSLDGGTSWPIEYVVDKGFSDGDIGDGKLLNKSGVAIWSANSKKNKTLDYNDLANQPGIHDWAEAQQVHNITKDGWTIELSRFTKVLIVTSDSDDTWANDRFIHIKPQQDVSRWGQVIVATNLGGGNMKFVGEDDGGISGEDYSDVPVTSNSHSIVLFTRDSINISPKRIIVTRVV